MKKPKRGVVYYPVNYRIINNSPYAMKINPLYHFSTHILPVHAGNI
jgi:hypothetical protein